MKHLGSWAKMALMVALVVVLTGCPEKPPVQDWSEEITVTELPRNFHPFGVTVSIDDELIVVGYGGDIANRYALGFTTKGEGEWQRMTILSGDGRSVLLTVSEDGNYAAGQGGIWNLHNRQKVVDVGSDTISAFLENIYGTGWSPTGEALLWQDWDVTRALPEGFMEASIGLAIGIDEELPVAYGATTDQGALKPAMWRGTEILESLQVSPETTGAWVNSYSLDITGTAQEGRGLGGGEVGSDETVYAVFWKYSEISNAYEILQLMDNSGNRVQGQIRSLIMVGNSPFGVGGPDSLVADLGGPIDIPSNATGEAIIAMDEMGITMSQWLERYGKSTPNPVRTLRTIIHYGGYFYALGVMDSGVGVVIKIPVESLNDW